MMEARLHASQFVCAALLAMAACATTPYRLAERRVTATQWGGVAECVTLSARASQRHVDVGDSAIRVSVYLPRDLQEHIWFLRRSNEPDYAVRSVVRIFDPRAGNGRPLTGATQETRRLRQQLDSQCLGTFPIANDTSSRGA
jgi:hypothetical protein